VGVSGGTCGYTAQQGLFSIGFSNGAAFALRLGCQAAHLHRAIAAGSGWISVHRSGRNAGQPRGSPRGLVAMAAPGSVQEQLATKCHHHDANSALLRCW
jgi:predicted esterase